MPRSPIALALLLAATACTPELGAEAFTVTGDVMVTGRLGGLLYRTKFAAFYTGDRMFTMDPAFEEGDPTEIVSNVVDLGRAVDEDVPFTLNVDVTDYDDEGDTVTFAAWVDQDGDDEPDVGELRTRMLPNLTSGCPVYGAAGNLVPVHYAHLGDPVPLFDLPGGWHQDSDVDYLPAADADGAHIESEVHFVP